MNYFRLICFCTFACLASFSSSASIQLLNASLEEAAAYFSNLTGNSYIIDFETDKRFIVTRDDLDSPDEFHQLFVELVTNAEAQIERKAERSYVISATAVEIQSEELKKEPPKLIFRMDLEDKMTFKGLQNLLGTMTDLNGIKIIEEKADTNSVILLGDNDSISLLKILLSNLPSDPVEKKAPKVITETKVEPEIKEEVKPAEVIRVVDLNYGDANELMQNLQQVLGGGEDSIGLNIAAHVSANQLILSGKETDVTSTIAVIKQLDRAPRQVYVDAIIAEVSEESAKKLGLQFSVNSDNISASVVTGVSGVNIGSTASNPDSKDYTTEKGQRAIQDHLNQLHQRGYTAAKVERVASNRFRCRWHLPKREPSVELIIPTRDKAEILELAVSSILSKTDYSNYKICIVDNQSKEQKTINLFKQLREEHPKKVRIIHYRKPFNYSAINNAAARRSKADFLGLINNDVEAINSDWLREMVSHARRPDVGCVGAKLFYSNDTIQHGGVVIGIGEVAGHAHKYFPRSSLGYTDRLNYTQQSSAVTAACLLIKRSIYYEVGGLNEQDLRIAFNDVDFCLRVHARGYKNIFTPYATLYHHESISRGTEDTVEKQQRFLKEINFMLNQYDVSNMGKLPSDLFYNPNLTGTHENFSLNLDLNSVQTGIRQRQRLVKQSNYYLRSC